MDDHKAMQNESEELAALLGYVHIRMSCKLFTLNASIQSLLFVCVIFYSNFDIDFNFDLESLFRELPPDAGASCANDTSSILQCHLVPTEPRPSSEFDNVNAPSRLRHILDVTRRHFEGPEKTPTIHALDAKTASGEEHVSHTLLPNVNASGNTEECARKRKHVSDVDAGGIRRK
ncbi:hypothetical protein PIB30_035895 [Stylosanthes scabra]|uniref:Uncharacterized protein n=1 Tax=Stylosanthes scabra TaxID=79078 RepID=A0ABU6VES6_9FABA|nr:hypothetical protein [Stylosanthes scabra]